MRLPVVCYLFPISVVLLQVFPVILNADKPERLDLLESEIAKHDQAYYQKNAPTISDVEYDALQEERVALAHAPGQAGIGDDRLHGFEKFSHLSRMLSLKKAHDVSELNDFYDRVIQSIEKPHFIVEPKIDGIAINLVYINGSLEKAVTRGNGSEGDVVMKSIQQVVDLPLQLNCGSSYGGKIPGRLEIRGELYVEKEAFKEVNRLLKKVGKPTYATPRSLAAGLSRSWGVNEWGKFLRVVVFDWGIWESEAGRLTSYSEFKNLASSWGFRVLEVGALVTSRQGLLDMVKDQLEICWNSTRPCDGVVVKLDDVRSRDILGRTERAPNWAIACKFPAKTASTIIEDIHLQMGRTGCITPVAELVPVQINRRHITRMNLNSPSFVKAMDVRVGDRVTVALSGDVIPVLKMVERENRNAESVSFAFPDCCPFCQTEFVEAAPGSRLYCPNYRCSERLKRRLEHFADNLGLIGLGPVSIGKLVDGESVGTYSDLLEYYCHDHLRPLEPELWQIIVGIGIPNLGAVSARKLAATLGSLQDLYQTDTEILRSGELPERLVRSIEQYVSHPQAGDELRELVDWFDSHDQKSTH